MMYARRLRFDLRRRTASVFFIGDGRLGYALSGETDCAELLRVADAVCQQLNLNVHPKLHPKVHPRAHPRAHPRVHLKLRLRATVPGNTLPGGNISIFF